MLSTSDALVVGHPEISMYIDAAAVIVYLIRVWCVGSSCWAFLVLLVLPTICASHANALLRHVAKLAGIETSVVVTAWPPSLRVRNVGPFNWRGPGRSVYDLGWAGVVEVRLQELHVRLNNGKRPGRLTDVLEGTVIEIAGLHVALRVHTDARTLLHHARGASPAMALRYVAAQLDEAQSGAAHLTTIATRALKSLEKTLLDIGALAQRKAGGSSSSTTSVHADAAKAVGRTLQEHQKAKTRFAALRVLLELLDDKPIHGDNGSAVHSSNSVGSDSAVFSAGAVSPEFARWYHAVESAKSAPRTHTTNAPRDEDSDATAEMVLLDTYEQIQALMPDFPGDNGADGATSAGIASGTALPTVHELAHEAICTVHRDFWEALREEGEKQVNTARRAAADAMMLQLADWMKIFALAGSSAGDAPRAAEQSPVQKIVNSCINALTLRITDTTVVIERDAEKAITSDNVKAPPRAQLQLDIARIQLNPREALQQGDHGRCRRKFVLDGLAVAVRGAECNMLANAAMPAHILRSPNLERVSTAPGAFNDPTQQGLPLLSLNLLHPDLVGPHASGPCVHPEDSHDGHTLQLGLEIAPLHLRVSVAQLRLIESLQSVMLSAGRWVTHDERVCDERCINDTREESMKQFSTTYNLDCSPPDPVAKVCQVLLLTGVGLFTARLAVAIAVWVSSATMSSHGCSSFFFIAWLRVLLGCACYDSTAATQQQKCEMFLHCPWSLAYFLQLPAFYCVLLGGGISFAFRRYNAKQKAEALEDMESCMDLTSIVFARYYAIRQQRDSSMAALPQSVRAPAAAVGHVQMAELLCFIERGKTGSLDTYWAEDTEMQQSDFTSKANMYARQSFQATALHRVCGSVELASLEVELLCATDTAAIEWVESGAPSYLPSGHSLVTICLRELRVDDVFYSMVRVMHKDALQMGARIRLQTISVMENLHVWWFRIRLNTVRDGAHSGNIDFGQHCKKSVADHLLHWMSWHSGYTGSIATSQVALVGEGDSGDNLALLGAYVSQSMVSIDELASSLYDEFSDDFDGRPVVGSIYGEENQRAFIDHLSQVDPKVAFGRVNLHHNTTDILDFTDHTFAAVLGNPRPLNEPYSNQYHPHRCPSMVATGSWSGKPALSVTVSTTERSAFPNAGYEHGRPATQWQHDAAHGEYDYTVCLPTLLCTAPHTLALLQAVSDATGCHKYEATRDATLQHDAGFGAAVQLAGMDEIFSNRTTAKGEPVFWKSDQEIVTSASTIPLKGTALEFAPLTAKIDIGLQILLVANLSQPSKVLWMREKQRASFAIAKAYRHEPPGARAELRTGEDQAKSIRRHRRRNRAVTRKLIHPNLLRQLLLELRLGVDVDSSATQEKIIASIYALSLRPCDVSKEQRCTLLVQSVQARGSQLIGFEPHPTDREDTAHLQICVTATLHDAHECPSTGNSDAKNSDETHRQDIQCVETLISGKEDQVVARDLAVSLSESDIATLVAIQTGFDCAMPNNGTEQTQVEADDQKEQELKTITREFLRIDADGDGTLDVNELRVYVSEVLLHSALQHGTHNSKLIPLEIDHMTDEFMKHLDADGSGEVEFDEFCDALYSSLALPVCLTCGELTAVHGAGARWSRCEPHIATTSTGKEIVLDDMEALGWPDNDGRNVRFWERYLEQAEVEYNSLCGQSPKAVQTKMVRAFAGMGSWKWLQQQWEQEIVPHLPSAESKPWLLSRHDTAGGACEIDIATEIRRYAAFWDQYEEGTGVSRIGLEHLAQDPTVVQRRMVHTFRDFQYARQCWTAFILPNLKFVDDDNAELLAWALDGEQWRFPQHNMLPAPTCSSKTTINLELGGIYVRIKDTMQSHTDVQLQVALEEIELHAIIEAHAPSDHDKLCSETIAGDKTDSTDCIVKFTLRADYYNVNRADLEPLIEPWVPTVAYSEGVMGSSVTVTDADMLNINATEMAVATLYDVQRAVEPIVDPGAVSHDDMLVYSHDNKARYVDDNLICWMDNATDNIMKCCIRREMPSRLRAELGLPSTNENSIAPTWIEIDYGKQRPLMKPNTKASMIRRDTKEKWIEEAFDGGELSAADILREFGPDMRNNSARQARLKVETLNALLRHMGRPDMIDAGPGASQKCNRIDFMMANALHSAYTTRQLCIRYNGREIVAPLDHLRVGNQYAYDVGDGGQTLIVEVQRRIGGKPRVRLCSGVAIQNCLRSMLDVEIIQLKPSEPDRRPIVVFTEFMHEHQRKAHDDGEGDAAYRPTSEHGRRLENDDPHTWESVLHEHNGDVVDVKQSETSEYPSALHLGMGLWSNGWHLIGDETTAEDGWTYGDHFGVGQFAQKRQPGAAVRRRTWKRIITKEPEVTQFSAEHLLSHPITQTLKPMERFTAPVDHEGALYFRTKSHAHGPDQWSELIPLNVPFYINSGLFTYEEETVGTTSTCLQYRLCGHPVTMRLTSVPLLPTRDLQLSEPVPLLDEARATEGNMTELGVEPMLPVGSGWKCTQPCTTQQKTIKGMPLFAPRRQKLCNHTIMGSASSVDGGKTAQTCTFCIREMLVVENMLPSAIEFRIIQNTAPNSEGKGQSFRSQTTGESEVETLRQIAMERGVWEHERFCLGRGWGHGADFLHSTDPHWKTVVGTGREVSEDIWNIASHTAMSDEASGSASNQWIVDVEHSVDLDEDGWEYEFDFSWFDHQTRRVQTEMSTESFVRRRKWIVSNNCSELNSANARDTPHWEHERWVPKRGWCSDFVPSDEFVGDRQWKAGLESVRGAVRSTYAQGASAVADPRVQAEKWAIVHQFKDHNLLCDEDGWQYHTNFTKFGKTPAAPSQRHDTFVRRRCWVKNGEGSHRCERASPRPFVKDSLSKSAFEARTREHTDISQHTIASGNEFGVTDFDMSRPIYFNFRLVADSDCTGDNGDKGESENPSGHAAAAQDTRQTAFSETSQIWFTHPGEFEADGESQQIVLHSSDGKNILCVQMERKWDASTGVARLVIFCPLWVSNRSGLPLEYQHSVADHVAAHMTDATMLSYAEMPDSVPVLFGQQYFEKSKFRVRVRHRDEPHRDSRSNRPLALNGRSLTTDAAHINACLPSETHSMPFEQCTPIDIALLKANSEVAVPVEMCYENSETRCMLSILPSVCPAPFNRSIVLVIQPYLIVTSRVPRVLNLSVQTASPAAQEHEQGLLQRVRPRGFSLRSGAASEDDSDDECKDDLYEHPQVTVKEDTCVPVYLFPTKANACCLHASSDKAADDINPGTSTERQQIKISEFGEGELTATSYVTICHAQFDAGTVKEAVENDFYVVELADQNREITVPAHMMQKLAAHHTHAVTSRANLFQKNDKVQVSRNAAASSASLVRAVVTLPPPTAAEHASTVVDMIDCTSQAPFCIENRSPQHHVLVQFSTWNKGELHVLKPTRCLMHAEQPSTIYALAITNAQWSSCGLSTELRQQFESQKVEFKVDHDTEMQFEQGLALVDTSSGRRRSDSSTRLAKLAVQNISTVGGGLINAGTQVTSRVVKLSGTVTGGLSDRVVDMSTAAITGIAQTANAAAKATVGTDFTVSGRKASADAGLQNTALTAETYVHAFTKTLSFASSASGTFSDIRAEQTHSRQEEDTLSVHLRGISVNIASSDGPATVQGRQAIPRDLLRLTLAEIHYFDGPSRQQITVHHLQLDDLSPRALTPVILGPLDSGYFSYNHKNNLRQGKGAGADETPLIDIVQRRVLHNDYNPHSPQDTFFAVSQGHIAIHSLALHIDLQSALQLVSVLSTHFLPPNASDKTTTTNGIRSVKTILSCDRPHTEYEAVCPVAVKELSMNEFFLEITADTKFGVSDGADGAEEALGPIFQLVAATLKNILGVPLPLGPFTVENKVYEGDPIMTGAFVNDLVANLQIARMLLLLSTPKAISGSLSGVQKFGADLARGRPDKAVWNLSRKVVGDSLLGTGVRVTDFVGDVFKSAAGLHDHESVEGPENLVQGVTQGFEAAGRTMHEGVQNALSFRKDMGTNHSLAHNTKAVTKGVATGVVSLAFAPIVGALAIGEKTLQGMVAQVTHRRKETALVPARVYKHTCGFLRPLQDVPCVALVQLRKVSVRFRDGNFRNFCDTLHGAVFRCACMGTPRKPNSAMYDEPITGPECSMPLEIMGSSGMPKHSHHGSPGNNADSTTTQSTAIPDQKTFEFPLTRRSASFHDSSAGTNIEFEIPFDKLLQRVCFEIVGPLPHDHRSRPLLASTHATANQLLSHFKISLSDLYRVSPFTTKKESRLGQQGVHKMQEHAHLHRLDGETDDDASPPLTLPLKVSQSSANDAPVDELDNETQELGAEFTAELLIEATLVNAIGRGHMPRAVRARIAKLHHDHKATHGEEVSNRAASVARTEKKKCTIM